ncbi:MAG: hypothetical protein J6L60_03310 [Bacteroidaceae bacterium]|nr:hypothetical protein [Bacteroidaceae bacterium]
MASKQNENIFVCCINCKWAELMQWFENPIIANCKKKDDRQVAATKRLCKEFAERTGEADIKHFSSYED